MSRRPLQLKSRRYAEGYEYDSDYSDDITSSDEDEPRIPLTHKGYKDPRKYTSNRRGFEHCDTMSSTTTYSSNLSSSLDITEDTTESSLFSGAQPYDTQNMYARIQRRRERDRSPTTRAVFMNEEISPIRSDDVHSRNSARGLNFQREWRPQHTSTTTDMQSAFAVPKTNPHMGLGMISSTPIRRAIPVLTTYHEAINMEKARPKSYHEIEKDPSRVWDNTRPTATLARSRQEDNSGLCRSEHYGMPAAYAKNHEIKGILFLNISKYGSMLSVMVSRGAYFAEKYTPPMTTYVKVELRSRNRKRQTSSSSMKRHESHVSVYAKKSSIVRSSNIPEFRSTLEFDLGSEKTHLELFVCVWAMNSEHSSNSRSKQMVGCMTFHLSKLIEKAAKNGDCNGYYKENHTNDEVPLREGGFFLLNGKRGEKNNLPQDKVTRTEYYNDPALSGGLTSSFSSSGSNINQRQMPMEEFVVASRNFGSSMVPGYSTSGVRHRVFEDSSASSSTFSRDGLPLYHGMHRSTLPNIITTSDSSEHEVYYGGSGTQRQDPLYLYVDANQNARKHQQRAGSPNQSPSSTKQVRRATSFTFSPKDSVAKYNKRPAQVEEKERRKIFGPISKTISFIKNRMDVALSSSSLCPTIEDVQQWEHCFDALLKDKVGAGLFRQFLKKEFCDENLEFWCECEEFKKMKEEKKNEKRKQRANEIYKVFICEQAPRQVNIDSDTRAATKAALESGCRTDTFNLAQTQIEHLMKTHSYKRFLKDQLYLDLVATIEETQKRPQQHDEAS